MTSQGSSRQPGSLPRKLRAVVFEPSWYASAMDLVDQYGVQRWDEVCAGIYWLMEYGAHECPPVEGSPFYVAKAVAPGGTRLRAFFTVDDENDPAVRAWYVEVIKDEPAAEEGGL